MSQGWILFVLCVSLVLYVSGIGEHIEMAMSDLQKLIENMKRAQAITNRAGNDAARHASIMDSFEQRLNLNHETMTKIEEYDKLMAQMDAIDNGGPALEATFPSSISRPSSSRFDEKTGRQL